MVLRPTFEGVHIRNALKLPISCLQRFQSKVSIKLQELPDNIAIVILTDKQWLQENLLCLLSNAVKYSNRGDVILRSSLVDKTPSVSVLEDESSTEMPSLLFEIEDSGIGLSDDQMQTLFQPFQKAQRLTSGGTGLGLFSLAKRMEALKGAYGVKPRNDGEQGCLFWFCIPYRPMENDEEYREYNPANDQEIDENYSAAIEGKANLKHSQERTKSNLGISLWDENDSKLFIPHAKSKPPETSIHSALRILLVDDSMTIVKITSNLLRSHGHQVTVAVNGADALEIATVNWGKFDVCLMDLQMPVMDGFECVKRLRKAEKIKWKEDIGNAPKSLFVMGCSANCDNDTVQEAYRVGMNDFIAKPLRINAFNNAVNSVMYSK